MDEGLIEAWNMRVRPQDTVWHLGDFAYRSARDVEHYWNRLNGHKFFIFGNHDDDNKKKIAKLAVWSGEARYVRVDGHRLWLSHYACRVWRSSHHGSFHLYGHSHGTLPGLGRSMDVGVDAVGYAPISIDEVVSRLKDLPISEEDYHKEEHDFN